MKKNVKSKISRNAIMGIVFLASILMLYLGLSFLKGINVFRKQNNYVAIFDNVLNLHVSSPVLVNGFQIGLVRSIEMFNGDPSRLAVEIRLDKDFKVKKGSKLMFNADFLGASTVNLVINPYASEYLQPGDTIVGSRAPDVMKSVEEVIPKAAMIMQRLDTIAVTLQTFIQHPAWEGSLLAIDQTTKQLSASSKNLNNILLKLNQDLPVITSNLSVISNDVRSVTTDIKQADVAKTLAALDATVGNLKQLSEQLNSTDNSVGKLINGTELHDSINVTLNRATRLLENIKSHPERYLSVRLRLF